MFTFELFSLTQGPDFLGMVGKGGVARGELTVELFLTLESSASQSRTTEGGHASPFFASQNPGCIAGSRDPSVPTRKGEGYQGSTRRRRFPRALALRPCRCILLPGRTGSSFWHLGCPLVPGSDSRHCSLFPLSQCESCCINMGPEGHLGTTLLHPLPLLASPVLFHPPACSPGFS